MMALHYRKLGSMFFYSNKFDRAKHYYNRALKGWEITRNYFAIKGMNINSKHKLITSWAELKSRY